MENKMGNKEILCRNCGAQIVFVKSKKGKFYPADAYIEIVDGIGFYIPKTSRLGFVPYHKCKQLILPALVRNPGHCWTQGYGPKPNIQSNTKEIVQ